MKQCPNCRCQVDVQAATCPFCGITLPLYRKARPFGDTHLRAPEPATHQPVRESSRRAEPPRAGTVRSTSGGAGQPARQGTKPRTGRSERFLHRDHQLIILLLTANLVIGLAQLLVQLLAF